jgi:ferredoxin, 2Fe-2S
MNKITFLFEEKGKEPIVLDCPKGESILEITLQNDLGLHHNCGGVCACSTCHIYVEKGMDFLEELSDREEDFIDRAKSPKLNSRLACQCVLLEDNKEITVTIADQSLLLGD